MQRILFISVFFLLSTTLEASQFIRASGEFDKQRALFKNLVESQKLGSLDAESVRGELETYPLYPYIEYHYLLNHLKNSPRERFENFFKNNDDLATSSYLRKLLLSHYGEQEKWENFRHFYKEEDYFLSDNGLTELKCFYLQSLVLSENEDTEEPSIEIGTDHAKKFLPLYLTGESLPDACDPLIDHFEKLGLIDQSVIFNRLESSFKKGNITLAEYLSKKLDAEFEQPYKACDALLDKPHLIKDKEFGLDDSSFSRLCITEALRKILETDPPLAMMLWKEQKQKYDFSKKESIDFIDESAMDLFIRNSEHFESWYEISGKSAELNSKILVQYIKDKNWTAIISKYPKLKPVEQGNSKWQYWYARSYIEYDENANIHPNALRILEQLSRKRDYYGFLASFHLNTTPVFSDHNFPIKEQALKKIANNINIIRAHEFYLIGDRVSASREWFVALQEFNEEERGTASILAYQWGWLEQAIFSAARSNQINNLKLRFPLGFQEKVNYYAAKNNIPNEWVFATIRQESAYAVNAESSAGALGLMQIMPYTGKVLAREEDIKRFRTDNLLEPDLNVRLGTYYLSRLREQYQGNMLLASAAYNAGPSNVNDWIRRSPDMDIEMWIETIPYKETRNYVKNILTYQIIYQKLLGRQVNPERLFLPLP